ncbi:RING/U-box superfamily protein [Thalictrum thalictroides]|uniref:RING-type E3 ubiquitin transferase n=1 Tax=Thalictrum thalictroides TaxID=46969 RepID=A0A7J6V6P2_THATH|nr:RING/U-box superfamily protein [Thalictrum thalictroides]
MVMKSVFTFFYHLINLRIRSGSKETSYLIYETYVPKRIANKDADELALAVGGAAAVIHHHEAESCSVCLSRLREGDEIRTLPCLHVFHRMCVDRWLNMFRKTCPLCRFSVEGESSSHKKDELTEEMALWFSSFHVTGF